ncbi:hypothetical protein V1507DRAFT_483003 [Lipomyces tetrasporus]
MSMVPPTPEYSTLDTSSAPPPTSSQSSKSQRVLSCVLCQQRKVKCDRKFPCANCSKFRAQCVPATLPRRRRRRFPERELLDRIRKYEDLLRQNSVKFEPLHKDIAPQSTRAGRSSPSTSVKPKELHEAKNFWHAMRQQGFREPDNESESSHDDVSEIEVKKAWDQLFADNDNLLFGSRKTAVDLSTLHPELVQIFRLWQIYLNNVDPLLKVTHTPSLQGRLIEAASNVAYISPTLEALMFSVYSMSIMSLTADECQATFGSSKEDLLTRYQFGCQQGLLNCGYLRTGDRECLTAFYLFLVSVGPSTDPRSLSSMLGVAMRIAHRMGIHSESACVKCTALEAEMRRRLWWSLKLFDSRIGELADYKTVALAPTWDCRIPLNVNDSDLRPEMTEPPPVQGTSSEALFVVVRSELGEFIRHTKFHLDFTTPALKPVAKDVQQGPIPEGGELVPLEKMIEDKYLKFCNPDNPLHFMTIWTTRTYLAKCRLVEHYSRYSDSSMDQTEAQRDAAICHALNMLECDTKIMNSPLTRGYLWLVHFHFPFPAYIHILQDLRRRPVCEQAEQAWEVMSDNFEVRVNVPQGGDSPLFNIFTKIVLSAWESREATFGQSGEPDSVTQKAQNAQSAGIEQPHNVMGTNIDNLPMTMPMGFGNYGLLYGAGGQDGYAGTGLNIPGQARLDIDINQLDWAAMDWDFGGRPT